VIESIRARFDVVETHTENGTVLSVHLIDQSAVRTLMIML
jgi:hypothetical protein